MSEILTLTSHQEVKEPEFVCLTLANLCLTVCSTLSTADFYKRINVLAELQHKWQNHDDILHSEDVNVLINDEHNYYTKSILGQEKHLKVSQVSLTRRVETGKNKLFKGSQKEFGRFLATFDAEIENQLLTTWRFLNQGALDLPLQMSESLSFKLLKKGAAHRFCCQTEAAE